MSKIVTAGLITSMVIISACAKKSENIAASYVSPVQYETYSCRQISEEAARVSARASSVMGVQDKKAENDTAATAIGLVLFWPALFFIKGNAETTAEVARLKGEMDALEQANIRKNCGIKFQHAPVKATEKEAKKATE